jgi:chemotaxis protein CheX
LKVEYLDPFVQGADLVLKEFSVGGVKTGGLGLLGTTFPTASINITTRVDGSLRGDVVYSMSSVTARKLAGLITGMETHTFGRRMGEGLSQFGNILAEQTGKLLEERGLECEFSSPTIFQGLNVEFSATAPALAVPIDTDVGRVEVSVAVDYGEPS